MTAAFTFFGETTKKRRAARSGGTDREELTGGRTVLFLDPGRAAGAGAAGRLCAAALAAVPLLAKHEQKSPSAEQPFSECRGGEEQGAYYGDLCFGFSRCICSPTLANLAAKWLKSRL